MGLVRQEDIGQVRSEGGNGHVRIEVIWARGRGSESKKLVRSEGGIKHVGNHSF